MIKVLQVNTNRSKAALDLLEHMTTEQRVDVILVAEPNKKMVKEKGWLIDKRGDTSIKIVNKTIKVKKKWRRGRIHMGDARGRRPFVCMLLLAQ